MSGDQFGVPGCDSRAEPPCTVGAAALPPSGSVSGKADPGLVTKVNLFYNGRNRKSGIPLNKSRGMRRTDYTGHNHGLVVLSRGWQARGGYATLAVITAAALA